MSEGIMEITYKNYRGEISKRKLVPLRVYWSEGNSYHPVPQYLMEAVDVSDPEKPKVRDFAILDFNPKLPSDLRKRVFDNLDNAKVNGEFVRGGNLYGHTIADVAVDLTSYADDLADENPVDLEAYVIEWKKVNGIP